MFWRKLCQRRVDVLTDLSASIVGAGAAQEGFLKAWRSIQKFEGRSSFYTWLHSLTVNLAIDSLRRKGRRVEVELDDAIPCSLPTIKDECKQDYPHALQALWKALDRAEDLIQN